MNTTKEARRDAVEFARAQMFYGEGAGIRRKLIQATVDAKIDRDPVYSREFNRALQDQDMAEHASKARKERSRTDRNEIVTRNVRGALTGNSKSMNTSVLVLVAVGYVAHKTGADKVAYEKTKAYVKTLKGRYERAKARQSKQGNNVYNITNI